MRHLIPVDEIKPMRRMSQEEVLEMHERLKAIFAQPATSIDDKGNFEEERLKVAVTAFIEPKHPRLVPVKPFENWVLNQWRWSVFNDASFRAFINSISHSKHDARTFEPGATDR